MAEAVQVDNSKKRTTEIRTRSKSLSEREKSKEAPSESEVRMEDVGEDFSEDLRSSSQSTRNQPGEPPTGPLIVITGNESEIGNNVEQRRQFGAIPRVPTLHRRSPGQGSEFGSDNSGIDITVMDTPFGGAVNHMLSQESGDTRSAVLPEKPAVPHVKSYLRMISDRVERFGPDFRARIGWIGEFEQHHTQLEAEITELVAKCMEMEYLEQLEDCYNIKDTLFQYMQSHRSFAVAERSRQGLAFPFRSSPLTRRSQQVPLGDPQTPKSGGQTEDLMQELAVPGRSNLNEIRPRTSSQNHRQLQLRVKNLEKNLTDNVELQRRLNDIEVQKATKEQHSDLAFRICTLEQESQKFKENKIEKRLTDAETLNSANAAVCKRYETLSKGFCSENTKLRNDLKAANQTISKMQTTVGKMSDDIAYLLEYVNSSINDSGVRASQQLPTSQMQNELPRVPVTGIMGLQNTDQPDRRISVSGISQLPTSTVTVATNTQVGNMCPTSTVTMAQPRLATETSQAQVNRQQPSQQSNPFLQTLDMFGGQYVGSQQNNGRYVMLQDGSYQFIPDQPFMQSSFQDNLGGQVNMDASGLRGRDARVTNHASNNNSQNSSRVNSPMGSDSSSISGADNLSRRGIRLKRAGRNLKLMLEPRVSDKLTKVTVQGIHRNQLPAVDAERKEVNSLLEKYENEKPGPPDQDLLDEIESVIDDARLWARSMRQKYQELDCSKKSMDHKLYERMKMFGDSDTNDNIFEFIKKFEAYSEELPEKEKATLLYEQYLIKDVQLELVDRRDSYELMKKWLIRRFGDVTVITDNILSTLSKDVKPDDSISSPATTKYFRQLNASVKRIQELGKTVDMPVSDLQAHIYSKEFLTKLVSYIPERAKFDLYDRLLSTGVDRHHIRGEDAFYLIAATVYRHFCLNESSAPSDTLSGSSKGKPSRPETGKQSSEPRKKKAAHTASSANTVVTSSDDEDEENQTTSVHHQNTTQQKHKDKRQKSRHSTQFKFPCVIENHNHELGECTEFFGKKPGARKHVCLRTSCFSCLGPYESCKDKCKARIPRELICVECKAWADQNNRSPMNVLLCKQTDHTKPDEQTLIAGLKKHLPNFDPTKMQGQIKLAAHLYLVAHSQADGCAVCKEKNCVCKPTTLSSKVDKKKPTPVINTSTGKEKERRDAKIIEDSDYDSFYVMQLLNLYGTDVLTFFDRGANQHLINGHIAEELGLKVESSRPAAIGVVGGSQFWTKYGTYSVALGPTEDNYYYKFIAQGIDPITSKFPKYDLTAINEEVKGSGRLPEGTALPHHIGGMEAGLLIGINSTGLEPYLSFQLPCGLGVYKSPLKDKFNSRYCYGGPHKVFSDANKMVGNNFNHVNIFMSQMVDQYRNSLYPSLLHAVEPGMVDNESGLSFVKEPTNDVKFETENGVEIYPTAIDEVDMIEMGVNVNSADTEDEVCICLPCHGDEAPLKEVHHLSVGIHKARVPVSQRREYVDEEDQGFIDNFRCEDCAKCKKCVISDRSKMMSLQEKMDQEAINKSITVDLDNNRVYVDFPFVKNPVDFLSKKHGGKDNYKQALKFYQSQCRKPETMKVEMRKAHQGLVEKGFMKKLIDLTPEQQAVVNDALFRHFMPWNGVLKPDSQSTKFRMVVDASVTGINEILAKGPNCMSKINHILIRNRCRKHIWSTDISKMYNQLHLNDSALPYGLFLFSDELDPTAKPEVYVMMVAWYGVTSTGNQSGESVERVTEMQEEIYPLAVDVVKNDRYVDDNMSGDHDLEVVNEQIEQTRASLANGGFELKYIVKSGEEPCEAASADGKSIKVLGYRWTTKEDILGPGFSEINFSKRRRGCKKPNPFPVVSPLDVTKLLESFPITRRMVVAKIAEIWDPIGLWEPFKLQLKLDNSELKGMDYDVALEDDLQVHWKHRFQQFLEVPEMTSERCVVPEDVVDPDYIRLIGISDAAEKAGGCAVYAGYKRADGQYSCKLLTARSKLMNQKVPRNELDGVKLMAETVSIVKLALGDKVKEIHYFTDSTIAMCWCHNTSKRLRMFTLYRVADIRRHIIGSMDLSEEDPLPLYHIDGKLNIADLLTKHHDITPNDLTIGSDWQDGLPWMRQPFEEMPITTYKDLTLEKDDEVHVEMECFPEPILSTEANQRSVNHLQARTDGSIHCTGCKQIDLIIPQQMCYGAQDAYSHCDDCSCSVKFSCFSLKVGKGAEALTNVIKHGWLKTMGILAKVQTFRAALVHSVHKRKDVTEAGNCLKCKAHKETSGDPAEMEKFYLESAKQYLFQVESTRIKSVLPAKKLEGLIEQDGVLYHEGRLSEENPFQQSDLGFEVFFDNQEIKSLLPVVLSDSDLFFAHVMFVHNSVRVHSGVEITLREVFKTMMVLNNPRRVIQKIRRDCTKCRLIAKKTLELRMANHHQARNHITPPFYHCQVDTVFGFKGQAFKKARQTFKIYALIIVCLLTGATNILAMEGLETQDVIQAMERHASRHGVPAVLSVDNGTQLIAMENTKFNLRDMQTQVHDSLGLKVEVSNAKSHEERGRVEAKVKILRSMLDKLSVSTNSAMTAIQWETLFARISSMMDDVPIAKCSNSNVNDPKWDIITANRLKLGRNNNRSLEGWFDLEKGSGPDALLRRNQDLQKVWYQTFIDSIHHLIPRPAKWSKSDPLNVGDVVVFTYTENAMGKSRDVWKLGKIEKIVKKNKVEITYPGPMDSKGRSKKKTLVRCPRNISVVFAVGEIELNSRKYFESLKQ